MSGPHVPLPQFTHHPVSERQQIIRDITQFLTVALTIYVASLSTRSHTKIEEVEYAQKEVIVRQTEAAKKAEVVKNTLETKIEDDSEQRGIQLYSTWKYLSDVATISGNPRDKQKADEALKLYQRHLKKEP